LAEITYMQIELPAKLLYYFLWRTKSNINQSIEIWLLNSSENAISRLGL